jgi:kynurenine formamidase
MEAARWLVERRGIVGIMADTTVDRATRPEGVHTYFYLNGVLMIDNAAGFTALPAGRVFLAGGLTLKTSGIGSCPARPVAFRHPEESLERSEPIDLFQGISVAQEQGVPLRLRRLEPYELQADAFKRYQIVPVQIAAERAAEERQRSEVSVRAKRDFGSPIRLFNGRLGTHIIQPHQVTGSAASGTLELVAVQLPSTLSLVGHGVRIDLQEAGPRQVVSRQFVERQAARLQEGDIAVLWTGFTDRFYHRADYLKWSPRFSTEAIDWLLERKVKLIITDATTIEAWPWESREAHVAEEQCRLRGVPVVLAATNLWLMEQNRAYFICSPVPITGFPIVPARVVAVEEYR